MVRRSLVLALLLIASVAHAAPRWFTFQPPPGWTEASAQFAAQQKAMADQATSMSGTAQLTGWNGPNGEILLLVDSTFGDVEPVIEVLNGFDKGARESARKAGTEQENKEERTSHLTVGTQRVAMADGTLLYTKRFAGFGLDGKLVAMSMTCNASAEVCGAILTSITIDNSHLKPLASLGSGDSKSPAYRAGQLTGIVLIAALFGWFLFRRKSRADG